MNRFLVDENAPRSLAGVIRSAGHEAIDVRDVGLRGKSDAEVMAYANTNGLVLISRDADFGNVRRFPLGTHPGIIVARVPNQIPPASFNRMVLDAVRGLSSESLEGKLVVLEPGDRVRIREKGRTEGQRVAGPEKDQRKEHGPVPEDRPEQGQPRRPRPR